LLEECEDLFGVAFWFYFFEDVDEALVGTDEVGGALDAFDELAVHVLGLDEVVAVDELHVGVGEEIVREVVLVFEFFLVFDGVAGDAEDDDAGLLEFFEGVAEAAGFDGAAGGVGAGVEEEDDGGAFEVGEVDGLAVLILEGEVFYFVAGVHLVSSAVLEMQFIANAKLPNRTFGKFIQWVHTTAFLGSNPVSASIV
jgi:hypothetical protein